MHIIQKDTLCVTGYACNYLTSIRLTLARTEYLNQKAFIQVSCSKSINRCLLIRQCVICFVWLQPWYGAAIPHDSGTKLFRKVKVRLTVSTPYVDIADQYLPKSRIWGKFCTSINWYGQYHIISWASYHIRKIAGCACTGNAGNVFPPPRVSDPIRAITMAGPRAVIQFCSTHICMVQCTHLITTGGTPHLYDRGSSMLVNSLHSGENNT